MAHCPPMTTQPIAPLRPHSTTHHGQTVHDPYAWLRDAGYPTVQDTDVLAYLNAENDWFTAAMAPRQPLIDRLFAEMKGRVKEEDASVPYKDGDWMYWTDFAKGTEYRRWWRCPVGGGANELLLDENALAEGHEYFRLGAFSVSRDGTRLAYATDTDGSERFTARIKVIDTGELLPDTIPNTLSALVWVAGDTALAYCPANDQWRTDRAMLHRLGGEVADDVELYHEDDPGFRVGVGLTSSERWLEISAGDHETSEVRLVPSADPTAEPLLVRPRKPGVEYDVDDHDDTLFVLANDEHENFRLATAPLASPAEWTTVLSGDDRLYLTDVTCFAGFFVLDSRVDGLDQIEIRSYADPLEPHRIEFPEAAYVAGLGPNAEYATDVLRLSYQSMVSPKTDYDYHLADRRLEVLKVQEVPSGYDASQYRTERLTITARDGTQVPCSVVCRADREPTDDLLHLYGYGAYGMAMPPGFSTSRLSLVDRGFAYAIAHIRGGDDLGRGWYRTGKLTERQNTFNDFVDVAKGLVEAGWTRPGRISISGGSAGGGLMGAVVNSDPELWGAVVAHVPFVDVLNTMLDDTLPLTPGEWPEWGNPITDAAAFETIRAYSPYDNVRAQAYPPMLVTAGLNDPRVTYWEPAKWVAKLRATRTSDAVLLLKTNMGAGHGGKSGRWESLKEVAEEFAFILWQLGVESE